MKFKPVLSLFLGGWQESNKFSLPKGTLSLFLDPFHEVQQHISLKLLVLSLKLALIQLLTMLNSSKQNKVQCLLPKLNLRVKKKSSLYMIDCL